MIIIKFIFAFLSLILIETNTQTLSEWQEFQIVFNKSYKNDYELKKRMSIFYRNKAFINTHNKRYENGEVDFKLAVNRFADITHQEFIQSKLNSYTYINNPECVKLDKSVTKKKSIDWRKKHAVTEVKDQGDSCNSGWAFSSVGAIEGQNALKTKKLISLSAQNLIDCSKENFDCNGGNTTRAFDYVLENGGIDTDISYPYQGHISYCHFSPDTIGANITSYCHLPSGDETALEQAVAKIGPISVGIDASNPKFKLYSDGIYTDSNCSSDNLNHNVLIVGYGKKKHNYFWWVKNSWGTSWGIGGYMKLARRQNNLCGVASDAIYPIV